MNEFVLDSAFAWVTISLLTYMLGMYLKKRFQSGLLNPLLLSIAASIVILLAVHIDYEAYNAGAKYLSWFLTPATVCLAIPLYEQLELLKKNWAAVAAGITFALGCWLFCNRRENVERGYLTDSSGKRTERSK